MTKGQFMLLSPRNKEQFIIAYGKRRFASLHSKRYARIIVE